MSSPETDKDEEKYLPIPWGRTQRFLMVYGGLLIYLCMVVFISVTREDYQGPDAFSRVVFGLGFGALFCGMVHMVILSSLTHYNASEWYRAYRAQTLVGYDVEYRRHHESGKLSFEVVPSDDPHVPYSARTLRMPLGKRVWVPIGEGYFLEGRWHVIWVKQPQRGIPREHSRVRLRHISGTSFEMDLADAIWIATYITQRSLSSSATLMEHMVFGLVSSERLRREKGKLEQELEVQNNRLADAHEVMERTMVSIAHSDRLGNSSAGRNIRQQLARALCRMIDETDARRKMYEQYTRSARPPRIKGATTTT